MGGNSAEYLIGFLLTPLREGRRDLADDFKSAAKAISTHAPAGGATKELMGDEIEVIISTHAPAGGATQPSAEAESRIAISTHAPAGGATAS